MDLSIGVESSLIQKLNNAIQALNDGLPDTVINLLNAFISLVEAYCGRKITDK
jgi:hypothetical protein